MRSSRSLWPGDPRRCWRCAGLPLEAGNHLSLLSGKSVARQPDTRFAHGLKRLAKACCCSLGGGGGVVQFMRQTRGELAERHQFVALRLDSRRLADAVGHDGNQSLAEQRHALKHLREEASVEICDASWKHCPAGAAIMRQPRVGEQASNLPRKTSENHLIGAASPLNMNFPFEDYGEIVERFTLAAHDLSRLESASPEDAPPASRVARWASPRRPQSCAGHRLKVLLCCARKILRQVTPH